MNFAPCDANIIARVIILIFFIFMQVVVINYIYIHFFGELNQTSQIVGYWISIVLWTVFSLLWLWAHFTTSWLDAGSVQAQLKDLNLTDPSQYPPYISRFEPCYQCGLPKPPRTHHCSTCNRCYFRFDHHCPFIGNCVALKNMKPFLIFLIYSGILAFIGGSTFLLYLNDTRVFPHIATWIIFGCVMFLGVWLVSFGSTYIFIIWDNRTTLEGIANVNPLTYDRGAFNNMKQVFGDKIWKWFLPMQMEVNGFEWSAAQVTNLA